MKKSLADRIEQYIKVLIDRSEENQIEIQRSELAETFSCVPSQVTYVISTRFTENEGYFTHSRRGGNGYVRITRFYEDNDYRSVNTQQFYNWLKILRERNILSEREYELIKCLAGSGLKQISPELRNNYIAGVAEALKNFLNRTDY